MILSDADFINYLIYEEIVYIYDIDIHLGIRFLRDIPLVDNLLLDYFPDEIAFQYYNKFGRVGIQSVPVSDYMDWLRNVNINRILDDK